MLPIVAFVLSFVVSTLAYQVTFPNEGLGQGWSDVGPQVVNWTTVNTDALNFTIVLSNQQLSGFPSQGEVLLAFVVGSTLSATVKTPSAGWVDGSNYRVNFVKGTETPEDLNTIYAQSNQFNISSSSTTSSISGSSGATIVVPTASTTPTTGTTDTGSSASNAPSILSTQSSAAALSYPVQTGLLGLFSLLGFALA